MINIVANSDIFRWCLFLPIYGKIIGSSSIDSNNFFIKNVVPHAQLLATMVLKVAHRFDVLDKRFGSELYKKCL